MKNPFLKTCLFLLLFISPMVRSQSIGVSIGSGYYYITNNTNYPYADDPLKTISLRFSTNLDNNFRLNITSGYGFSNYRYNQAEYDPSYYYYGEYHELTDGFLAEIECQYQHYLTSDSIFEPTFGIGIGYCDFSSKLKNSNSIKPDEKIITKGFSQFISLGMNMHISKKITTYIELKKLIFSNIRINFLSKQDPSFITYEQDYSPMTGLSDLGITLGVNYNF
jgi:outer membrane protein W